MPENNDIIISGRKKRPIKHLRTYTTNEIYRYTFSVIQLYNFHTTVCFREMYIYFPVRKTNKLIYSSNSKNTVEREKRHWCVGTFMNGQFQVPRRSQFWSTQRVFQLVIRNTQKKQSYRNYILTHMHFTKNSSQSNFKMSSYDLMIRRIKM